MISAAESTVNQNNRTGRGGTRPGAGRKRGRPNLATPAEKQGLEDRAKQYTDKALAVLVEIAMTGESESARVTAANCLLDRGYGKPRQALEHSGEVALDVLAVRRRVA